MPEPAATQTQTGNATGTAAGANAGAGGDPFYQPYIGRIKPETLTWLDGKKFSSMEAALDSGALADRQARERNVVARPDPAKLNEWEGWSMLGWDADRAKYGGKIQPPKQPNGAAHDAELFDFGVQLGHELRMSPDQTQNFLQKLSDKVNERLSAMATSGRQAVQDYETSLRGEWKTDYDANMEIARRAAKTLGIGVDDSAELVRFFGGDGQKAQGSVRLTQALLRVGKLLTEGKLVTDDGLTSNADLTPARAMAEIRRLEGDEAFMRVFRDGRDPQHEDFKARYERLIAIAARDPKNVNPQPRRMVRG